MSADRYRNLALLFGSMLTVMGGLAIAPGLAGMGRHFADVPSADVLVKLVMTLPSLAIALSSFVMGGLVDRYGRRPVLLVSAVCCGSSGVAGYFLDSLAVILVTRALLGLSIAGLMTSLTTIAGDLFEGQERQHFLGLQSVAMSGGGIFFLGLGGVLADISWRMPFLLYGLAFVLLVGFVLFIQETGGRKHRQQQPQSVPGQSPSGGMERRQVFALAGIYVTVVGLSIAFYLIPVQLPFLFDELNFGASKVGVALAFMAFVSSCSAWFFRYLMNLLGRRLTLVWIFASLGLGLLVISQSEQYLMLMLGLGISGLGLGILMPFAVSGCMAIVAKQHMGLAVGTLTSFLFFGQFLSPLIVAPFLQYVSLSGVFQLCAEALLTTAMMLFLYQLVTQLRVLARAKK